MKKLILIGVGLAGAAAFIGFDAVGAFVDHTRHNVRSRLMSPEMELQAQLSEAKELSEKCVESVLRGREALARLDAMISERGRDFGRRRKALAFDRRVLEQRQSLLLQNRSTYLIGTEEVSLRTLNRDALLRAKAYATDKEIHRHVEDTVAELKAQRSQTAAEIEEATVEQRRLETEVHSLKAELENLKARRAVAQTRKEAEYVFDRSTFDHARDKIAEIRANIAVQNRRLDYFGRMSSPRKGLIPADMDASSEDGADAIALVLAEEAEEVEDAEEEVDVLAFSMNR